MATSAEIRQHLVDALGLDLIGPSWDDVARRHEHLPQPPSVWYTTGFLVPHVFEQEAGRTTEDEQLSFADLAGEEPSNGASNRLEKQEKDDDANDALDQANTRRSWFPSSLGLSFILEKGSTLEAAVTWGDYSAPADGAEEKLWSRTPQRQTVKISIDRPDASPDIPLEGQPQGLCLRWIARPAPSKLGYPSDQLSVSLFLLNKREPPQTNQIRHRDPVTAFQAELSLRCERGFPPRRDALQQAAKDPDERLAALQYRRDYCFASGHNAAVIASDIPTTSRPAATPSPPPGCPPPGSSAPCPNLRLASACPWAWKPWRITPRASGSASNCCRWWRPTGAGSPSNRNTSSATRSKTRQPSNYGPRQKTAPSASKTGSSSSPIPWCEKPSAP
jgi:hypothetical protein